MTDWSKTDKDFIPEKVTLGKFKEFAFLTCKFKGEKWVSPTIFERLCGYKPHTQRDSKKELKKAIFNAVDVIDNVPTKGFMFVSYGGNVYGTSEFNDNKNVILRDPRGFDFPVTLDEFFSLLRENGGNMKGNVLEDVECVYAWSSGSQWRYLLPTSSLRYSKVAANSKKMNDKLKNATYLTKKDFIEGHVYNGDPDKMPGKFMYMGVHDVYSVDCQKYAFSQGSYDCFKKAARDSKDISGEGKLVFYKLGATAFTDRKAKYSYAVDEPYVVRASFSKLILSEDSSEDGSSYEMYNSTLKCTYANIKADMEHSLLFNKIVLPLSGKVVPMSKAHFTKLFEYATESSKTTVDIEDFLGGKNKTWPFSFLPGDSYVRNLELMTFAGMNSSSLKQVKVSFSQHMSYTLGKYVTEAVATLKDTSKRPSRYCSSYYGYNNSSDSQLFRREDATANELYDMLKPVVNEVVLENGNHVIEEVAATFTHPNTISIGYNSWYDAD